MERNSIPFFMMLIFLASSCTVPLHELTYLNNVRTDVAHPAAPTPTTYRVKANDLLYIQVNGEDPKTSDFLNLMGGSGGYVSAYHLDLITYEVNDFGKISFPQMGEIKVEGLTVDEIRDTIQTGIDKLIKNSSVFVKLVERSITILGEVRNPGQKPMVRNQLTIFEALGAAGDITDYGNRKNVKLIRENGEGTLIWSVDLTDPALVSSPQFHIQPRDVIYVEPLSRVYGNKTMGFGTGFSIALSSISTILLIINLFL